ncbi:MAG: hypothetical protein A2267_06230 [Omnitrophica WOR_2 bacterium RIFOXYA12_FULL_38_10]|nr:MAG: hypothetical protein A2267_06230 [Omnitrophica WOR_2 bacterium RIFOXYA12_FULL_38_10]HBG61695.1 hypothetical protein [Candidatus Omnitrophota bacterium]
MLKNSTSDKYLIALGFFVAFFSSGIGIGGGAILVSMLTSVFGFDFKSAASTSLAMIFPITFVGAITHFCFYPGNFSIWYFMFIPMCVLGSFSGGHISSCKRLPELKYVFALFLVIVSFKMLHVFDLPTMACVNLNEFVGTYKMPIVMLFGFISGFISILLGVGCGLVMVPFFIIVLNFNIHGAICFSLTTMFFMSCSATFYHNEHKELNLQKIKIMIVPVMVGAILGASMSNNLPSIMLKKIFGIFLLFFACKILLIDLLKRTKNAG